jgi:hypothetical protein
MLIIRVDPIKINVVYEMTWDHLLWVYGILITLMLYKKTRTSTLMLMYETSSLLGCEKEKRLLPLKQKE